MKKLFTYLVVAATIVSTLGLAAVVPAASAAYSPVAGDKIKVAGNTAVYVIGADGKRHLFSNEVTYWSWYSGTWATQGVMTITQAELGNISTGANITVRPGSDLIRFDNSSKIYVVGMNGIIYEIDAATAAAWFPGKTPIVIQVAFEANYTKAAGVLTATSSLPDGSLIKYAGSDSIYVIVDGDKRMVTPEGFTANGFQSSDVVTVPATMTYDSGAAVTGKEGIFSITGSAGTPSPTIPPVSGNAGSVSNYDLVAGLSNEEVGESENDVQVAGLEIEADQGSDLRFTAVQIVFVQGTAGSDFDNYADEVSLWFAGEEVARVDGDEFNDDNDFSKTITLANSVVQEEDTEELILAISGINNLDSADSGDTWTADFRSVRFVDGQGASTTEDPGTGPVTFSFDLFADAADLELVVSLDDNEDDINDAHVINVDATDDTTGIEILAFTLEVEGNSDIFVKDIPVLITTTEAAGAHFNDPDDIIVEARLLMDGVEIGSESLSTLDADDDAETVVFEDVDVDLGAGDTEHFTVEVDVVGTDDVLDDGDTIQAELGATEVDDIDAEDESGEDIIDADATGTAVGEASEVRDVGITVALVSTSAVKTVGESGLTTDSGEFKITFDVTAFDGDVWVDHTAPDATGGTTESDLAITGTGTVLATITSSTGATDETDGFLVEEGTTERFTITTNISAVTDGFFDVALTDLLYALEDAQVTALDYTFNLDEFKTTQIFLDDQV